MTRTADVKQELMWFGTVLAPRTTRPLTQNLQARLVHEHGGAFVAREFETAIEVLHRGEAFVIEGKPSGTPASFKTGLTGITGPVLLDNMSIVALMGDALAVIHQLENELALANAGGKFQLGD
jgi:hypothetical protein